MEKNKTLLFIVLLAGLLTLLILFPLMKKIQEEPSQFISTTTTTLTKKTTLTTETTETTINIANVPLSKLQMVACSAADKGKTCFSELPKLGLVSPENCCKYLKKCC